jgi:hypothetical protein
VIGWIPKETARAIVEAECLNQLRPRLLKTFLGGRGYVEILFQILGPEDKKSAFLQAVARKKGGDKKIRDKVEPQEK